MKPYEPTEHENRIRAAIAAMPYGGLVHNSTMAYDKPITHGDVARYLENLALVLDEVSKGHAIIECELRECRLAIDGGAKLFALIRELL